MVDVTDEAFDPSEVDPDSDRCKFSGDEIFCRECADKLDGKLHDESDETEGGE